MKCERVPLGKEKDGGRILTTPGSFHILHVMLEEYIIFSCQKQAVEESAAIRTARITKSLAAPTDPAMVLRSLPEVGP